MGEVIGEDLDAGLAHDEGQRFRHGRRQRVLDGHRAVNEADPSNPKAIARPSDWPLQLLHEVRRRTDEELTRDAMAILGYQLATGWGDAKVAKTMGLTVHQLRTTLRVARERKLIEDVLAAQRARIEHDIVPKAVSALDKLVSNASEKSVLGVLQGTGLLRSTEAEQAPATTQLQVNVVVAPGEEARSIDPTNIVGARRVITPPAGEAPA